MRFDNPIYDHGFVLPDIASFPDVANEPRNESEDLSDIENLRNSIRNKDMSAFKSGYMKYVKHHDSKLFSKLDQMFNHYCNFPKSRVDMSGIKSNKIYDDLYENGVSFLDLNLDKCKKIVKPYVDELLGREDWRPPPGRMDRLKKMNDTPLRAEISKIFEESGIINAASKYNKGNRILKVANVVLHVSTPTDTQWQQFLYDCSTITKTTNMHIDPKEDVIKSMVYLDDVDEDSGPFSYVQKSNRWIHDEVQDVFGRSITTGSYCYTPKVRSAVFQFPKSLRVSFNFGRLLLDNTPEQDRMLNDQTVFTSSLGNVCVFDPAGIHRGAVCNTKNRIALQVLMK